MPAGFLAQMVCTNRVALSMCCQLMSMGPLGSKRKWSSKNTQKLWCGGPSQESQCMKHYEALRSKTDIQIAKPLLWLIAESEPPVAGRCPKSPHAQWRETLKCGDVQPSKPKLLLHKTLASQIVALKRSFRFRLWSTRALVLSKSHEMSIAIDMIDTSAIQSKSWKPAKRWWAWRVLCRYLHHIL